MSWINLKLYVAMICVILISCYIPAVIVDVHLTRPDLETRATHKLLRSIEKHRKQAFDVPYRDEKLKSGFKPLFYPDLLRSSDGEFTKLAKEYDVAPLAPQPKESLYYCNEGYGLLSYKSDRYGFRNSDQVWEQANKTFLIGDSFVHGACIPNINQTIAGYLKSVTNSINLGTGSNGPIHYAAIAKAIVKNFDAKNVVMVFYPNDNLRSSLDNTESYFYDYYWKNDEKKYLFNAGSEYVLNPKLIAFYDAVQDLLISGIKSSKPNTNLTLETPEHYELSADEARHFIAKNAGFFDLVSPDNFALTKIRSSIGLLLKSKKPDLPFSTKLAIDELAAVCTNSCKPVVAYIPNSRLWRPDARSDSYQILLQEYAKNKNIVFIDTSESLRLFSDSEVYAAKGPHLSPKGYQIVSELISEAIQK